MPHSGEISDMGPEPETEQALIDRALQAVRSRLPAQWSIDPAEGSPTLRADAVFKVSDPAGVSTVLVVEAKRAVVGRDIDTLVNQLRRQAAAITGHTALVAVGRYLPPQVRERLTSEGVNYIDATGNLRLALTRPALYIRDVGSASDPWRKRGRPRGSLQGRPAALVVRALADFLPPYSVPELVTLSGSSNGATYRVVDFLDEQGLVRRGGDRGPIVDVNWRSVLEAWTRDYSFFTNNEVVGYLAVRGIDRALDRLSKADPAGRYAVTGSVAAKPWTEYAPPRTLMAYVDDPAEFAGHLELRMVDFGANVLLARPKYDVVYQRTTSFNGLRITAPSQTAVDLATGPGRNPAEAKELLNWMARHEDRWRNVP